MPILEIIEIDESKNWVRLHNRTLVNFEYCTELLGRKPTLGFYDYTGSIKLGAHIYSLKPSEK